MRLDLTLDPLFMAGMHNTALAEIANSPDIFPDFSRRDVVVYAQSPDRDERMRMVLMCRRGVQARGWRTVADYSDWLGSFDNLPAAWQVLCEQRATVFVMPQVAHRRLLLTDRFALGYALRAMGAKFYLVYDAEIGLVA